MTPALIILAATTLAFAVLASWCARKAIRDLDYDLSAALDALAGANEAYAEQAREAAFWREQAERNAEDAGRWRMSRAARSRRDKAAQQAQRAPVLAKMAEMRGESE